MAKNYVGISHGSLQITEKLGVDSRKEIIYKAICTCGCKTNTTFRASQIKTLLERPVKKCVNHKTNLSELTYKSSTHRLYAIWSGMHNRCYNGNNPEYPRYGGRGVQVCDRWFELENFVEDMGVPNGRMSIDRIDNNGNYCPENCKWSTAEEQARNRRSNKVLDYLGKSQTMIEWCEELNLDYNSVQLRIQRSWSVERALNTPTEKPYAKKLQGKSKPFGSRP